MPNQKQNDEIRNPKAFSNQQERRAKYGKKQPDPVIEPPESYERHIDNYLKTHDITHLYAAQDYRMEHLS